MIRVKAETPVYGGYVIARSEGVVFIKGALPGETVLARTVEKKKDYSVAVTEEVLEPSAFRVEPFCGHFGVCGGCHLQHIAYAEQVSIKNSIIKDSLRRISGIEVEPEAPLTGNDIRYRHRAQFKVFSLKAQDPNAAIGFFREGTRDVVPVGRCPLLVDPINEALDKVRLMPASGFFAKEIHMTCGGTIISEGMTVPEGESAPEGQTGTPGARLGDSRSLGASQSLAVLLKGLEFDPALAREYAQAGFETVFFDGNNESGNGRSGRGFVTFDLLGFKYTVSPLSFFQSNWELNLKAAGAINELLASRMSPGSALLDIYAGGGNFSIPLSGEARMITAVEESASSVKDGLRNIEINGIKNIKFIKAPFEKFQGKGTFEAAIIDPPRPGLSREAAKKLLGLLPERLLYISCNPATLARDLKKLMEKYKVESVRLVDFFPHTYHMEVLCLLERR